MHHSLPVAPTTTSATVQSSADADAQLASLRHRVLACVEPMIALSTEHLHPDNRQRLSDGALSVVTYPNEYGGFVYVGPESENAPAEPELAALFELVRSASIVWIKFDRDAPVVDGLATFEDPPWA